MHLIRFRRLKTRWQAVRLFAAASRPLAGMQCDAQLGNVRCRSPLCRWQPGWGRQGFALLFLIGPKTAEQTPALSAPARAAEELPAQGQAADASSTACWLASDIELGKSSRRARHSAARQGPCYRPGSPAKQGRPLARCPEPRALSERAQSPKTYAVGLPPVPVRAHRGREGPCHVAGPKQLPASR